MAEWLEIFGKYLFNFEIFYEDMLESDDDSETIKAIETLEELKTELEKLGVKFSE